MLKRSIKHLYFVFGLLSMLLATIGVILPLMPTTPFALLAIFFFDRSSKKFHRWCMQIPFLGPRLNDWKEHKIICIRAKIEAVLLMFTSLGFVLWKETLPLELKLTTLTVVSLVLLFILTRRSRIPSKCDEIDNLTPNLNYKTNSSNSSQSSKSTTHRLLTM